MENQRPVSGSLSLYSRRRRNMSRTAFQAMADAYYVGAGDQDYIVLASADPRDYGIAAHENVHLILKTSNQQAPSWLQEGLAELLFDAGSWEIAVKPNSAALTCPGASGGSTRRMDAFGYAGRVVGCFLAQRRPCCDGFVLCGKLGIDRDAGSLAGLCA